MRKYGCEAGLSKNGDLGIVVREDGILVSGWFLCAGRVIGSSMDGGWRSD